MRAYPLPSVLSCAVCGFEMQAHGLFTGGAIVVSCTGFQCSEYDIKRKWQVAPVDLEELEAGDLVPMDVQPKKPETPVVAAPVVPVVETPQVIDPVVPETPPDPPPAKDPAIVLEAFP